MIQLCYDCDRRLPLADTATEGDLHQCFCGQHYRLSQDVIYIGEPITLPDCRIRRFYKVLYWASKGELPQGLPQDELDHTRCFVPKSSPQETTMKDCSGDGWYRCNECWRYEVSSNES